MMGDVEPWVTPHELSIEVRGERFLVRPRADSPGEYRYEWVSSPAPGYGFSGGFSGRLSPRWQTTSGTLRPSSTRWLQMPATCRTLMTDVPR